MLHMYKQPNVKTTQISHFVSITVAFLTVLISPVGTGMAKVATNCNQNGFKATVLNKIQSDYS